MKTYILIGGIGSGKTTVSKMLQQHGAVCLDLDKIGHEVLRDPEVIDMMVQTFGEDILDDSGEVDRKRLAAKAFATPADTVRLNSISQPRLIMEARRRLKEYAAAGKTPIAIVEISAYDGPDGTFAPFVRDADGVIAVIAPTRIRLERAANEGFNVQDVKNRIARQSKDEQRQLWADYVVNNKGTLDDLAEQVDDVWTKIS